MARQNEAKRYERVQRTFREYERFWLPRHEAMTEKAGFLLDGLHYRDSRFEELEKDSEFIRFVGQESFNVWRHEVALVTSAPSAVNARPLDQGGDDPDKAEQAVALIESEVDNPAKEYDDVFEGVVGAASACGVGVAWLDYMPDEGRWGELVPIEGDPRGFMWDPTVKSPHSLRCRGVFRKLTLTREQALEYCGPNGWRASVVAKLMDDGGNQPKAGSSAPIETHEQAITGLSTEGDQRFYEQDVITFWLFYERKAPDRKKADSGEFIEHEAGDRHMLCQHCGWTSPKQSTLAEDPEGPQEYPDEMACPDCTAVADRIDGIQPTETLLAYPDGKLSIIAPTGGVDKFVYEGSWQFPCRPYPLMFLTRFRHPLRVYGPSLADLNFWNQLAVDMVARIALERMAVSAPYWLAPKDGLVDGIGNPWQFTDDNGSTMYYTGGAMPQVQLLEGTGLPPSWASVYTNLRGALISMTGIADFGLAPGQSRDIAASSVAMQVQQQELPQAHYQRRYQREKGRFYGVMFDGVKSTYPDERIARIRGTSGADAIKAIRASDMPNFDFFISDAPDFSALSDSQSKAFEQIVGIIEQRPWAIDLAAATHGFPPSVVRKAKQAHQQFLDEQAQQAPPTGMAPTTPRGLPPGPGGQAPPGAGGPQRPPSAIVNDLIGTMFSPRPQPQLQ